MFILSGKLAYYLFNGKMIPERNIFKNGVSEE